MCSSTSASHIIQTCFQRLHNKPYPTGRSYRWPVQYRQITVAIKTGRREQGEINTNIASGEAPSQKWQLWKTVDGPWCRNHCCSGKWGCLLLQLPFVWSLKMWSESKREKASLSCNPKGGESQISQECQAEGCMHSKRCFGLDVQTG